VETEASREALRKELSNLQRKMAELIDDATMKEKDYQLALDDSRRTERKLDDQRKVGRHHFFFVEDVLWFFKNFSAVLSCES
jgi:hypothetical protein